MKQLNDHIGNTHLRKVEGVYFKCEFENPTGSVKDRSLSYQISKVQKLRFKQAVISSSGNAGISASYFCQKANIDLTVFVSYHIHPGKLTILKKTNATIIQTAKPISEANSFSKKNNAYNLRQSLDPYAVIGYKNISYELQKELSHPDAIFIPVSSGTMFMGIAHGFNKHEIPSLHAVQTEAVHPIASSFDPDYSEAETSIADGIVAKVTSREGEIIRMIHKTSGSAWIVSDRNIKKAWDYLIAHHIETSYEGAAALAALWKAKGNGYLYSKPVCILSGSFYE